MASQIEEIKSRIDIVELIGSYLKLQKAGANFKAPCPFHRERTPSFNVSPVRQIWHCFGCGKGGDIFEFIQEIDGVEFSDALKTLADRAGVKLQSENPQIRSERNGLLSIMEEAAKFFESNLFSEGTEVADGNSRRGVKEFSDATFRPLKYLKSRGLTDETIKEFRLGYAQAEWRNLFNHLVSKGFAAAEIEKAGLAVKQQAVGSRQPTYYDRFRGRIIFPIFDYNGHIVAFGGRIFPEKDNEAKYVNSPETPLYQKSKILYGLHKAKTEILREGVAVIVEGYMDMIMSYQAGVRNVVASSGTALTEDHLKILKRLSEKLIAAFDMDSAGEAAAKRGIDLALKEGFEIRVTTLGDIKDPADAVAKDEALWQEAVKNSKHIIEFYIDSVLKKYSADKPEAKREFQKNVLPAVSALAELERAHWVRVLSKLLNIQEEAVWSALSKIRSPKLEIRSEGENLDNLKIKSRKELLEEKILNIVTKYPALSEKVEVSIAKMLPPANHAAVFAELLLNDLAEAENELISCQRELKKEYLRNKLAVLTAEIYRAEKISMGQGGKDDALSAILQEFQKISAQLKEL